LDVERVVHSSKVREILRRVCAENGVDIIEGVLSSDHVHMFVSIPPKLSVSDLTRKMKGRSSFLNQREFPVLKKRCWRKGFLGQGVLLDHQWRHHGRDLLHYLEGHIGYPTGKSR